MADRKEQDVMISVSKATTHCNWERLLGTKTEMVLWDILLKICPGKVVFILMKLFLFADLY